MRVFTCVDHDGHWVGVASVIVANNEVDATALLRAALREQGLSENAPFTLQPLALDTRRAIVLQNGDY